MGIGHLDLTVVGKIIHLNLGIGRTVGGDGVIFAFGCRENAVRIGILKP